MHTRRSAARVEEIASLSAEQEALLDTVVAGLSAAPKRLPPALFYDDLGSALFDAICELPWYSITRAERCTLSAYAGAMVEEWGGELEFIELGSGNGEKIGYLADALEAAERRAVFHIIDVSPAALSRAAERLRPTGFVVHCHARPFEAGLEAVRMAPRAGRRIALFLGSNIGNFSSHGARALLRNLYRTLAPGDGLLLGADLVKAEHELRAAYADPLGVTAAFNKNLLVRLNHELGADFELDHFSHQVAWNAKLTRMESYLVSRREHAVRLGLSGPIIRFQEDEAVATEYSYKYTPETLRALVEPAGFAFEKQWTSPLGGFVDAFFRVV